MDMKVDQNQYSPLKTMRKAVPEASARIQPSVTMTMMTVETMERIVMKVLKAKRNQRLPGITEQQKTAVQTMTVKTSTSMIMLLTHVIK